MHSFTNRINTLFTFFGTVAAVLCFLTTSTDLLHKSDPRVSLGLAEDKALIKLKGHKTKYAFIDQVRGLRNRQVNLTLVWHVMPRVGEFEFVLM
eukprot:gene26205-11936_t